MTLTKMKLNQIGKKNLKYKNHVFNFYNEWDFDFSEPKRNL